jgi:signal transduction histidine kinase
LLTERAGSLRISRVDGFVCPRPFPQGLKAAHEGATERDSVTDSVAPFPSIDAARPARVLLVDDHPANLVTLEAVLSPLELDLVKASSGDEALGHLLHGEFTLILMDVQMPGLDGLETAKIIRSRKRTRHIPIIFITALSREAAYVTQGYAEGGVDYLLKPIDPEILRAKTKVFVDLYLRGEQVKAQAMELARQRERQEELERTAAFEQRLIGIVGHDIRTPLGSIVMSASNQLRNQALDDGARLAFLRIARGAERIRAIADLLMDFTRTCVGRGIPIQRELLDLRPIVHAVLDELRGAHPGRDFALSEPSNPVIGQWDSARLSQVLANLIDNAVKYGTPDEPISVKLAGAGADRAILRVHNHGTPIPEPAQAMLFAPFQRGLEAEHVATSLGLGLFIAREIVESHGGTISVRSRASEGTTFEVSLPLAIDASVEAVQSGLG